MSKELCDDPTCLACQFRREHPEVTNTPLIFTTAGVIKHLVGVMAQAEQQTRAIEGTLSGQLTEDAQIKLYNKFIKQFFVNGVDDAVEDLLALVEFGLS